MLEQKTEIKDEAIEEKKPVRKKKNKPAEKFDKSTYFRMKEIEIKEYNPKTKKTTRKIQEKEVIKEEYNSHLLKCRIRAAREYDVTLEHLKEAYTILNGKKIDGILVNELVDRYGFTDGEQESRVDLATRHNLKNKAYVEIATQKLKEIVSYQDVKASYMEYLNMTLTESTKEVTEDNLNQ